MSDVTVSGLSLCISIFTVLYGAGNTGGKYMLGTYAILR